MRIALLSLHFAEYSGRLAIELAVKHDVLLMLNAANARDELSELLWNRLERTVTLEVIEIPRFRNPRVLATIYRIYRRLRDFRPDVVHIQEFHQAFTGLPVLSMQRGTPVIMTVHDPLPHSGGLKTDGWRYRVVQWVRRRTSRMIVHGSRNRADLVAFNAPTSGRVDVVPHGILGRDTCDLIAEDCDPHTFLFFGRIEQYKGLRYLLDAGEILYRRGRNFRILIAGHGHDLHRHRERIAGSPWAELIEGFIPATDVPLLFRRALAVVLPYTDATQSGVSAMAFAYARPVIATDVGDVAEVVVDGVSGLIVPPRDADALADAMDRILKDRAGRDALAAGAARTARTNLSWTNIAALTQDVYRRALA